MKDGRLTDLLQKQGISPWGIEQIEKAAKHALPRSEDPEKISRVRARIESDLYLDRRILQSVADQLLACDFGPIRWYDQKALDISPLDTDSGKRILVVADDVCEATSISEILRGIEDIHEFI